MHTNITRSGLYELFSFHLSISTGVLFFQLIIGHSDSILKPKQCLKKDNYRPINVEGGKHRSFNPIQRMTGN